MKNSLRLSSLIVITSLLAACQTFPERDPYYDRPIVRSAPPAPYYEYQGYPPAAGYVWIGGYWNWVGVRYQWIPGRWEAPRPGYVWVPHRWEQRGGGWHQNGGHWDRHDNHHRQAAPPVVHHERQAPARVQEAPRHEQEHSHRHVEQPVLVRPAPQVERREQIEPPRSAAPVLARPEREARQPEHARPQERREEKRDRRERGNDRRQEDEDRRR